MLHAVAGSEASDERLVEVARKLVELGARADGLDLTGRFAHQVIHRVVEPVPISMRPYPRGYISFVIFPWNFFCTK
jgi:hypothetical protein